MDLIYKSTRNNQETATASEAILKGLAGEGGLFVPSYIPKLDKSLKELSAMSYQEVAYEVMKLFMTDFTEEELKHCINSAYDKKFDTESIAELVKKEDAYYLELFHGATIAFKDMALSILPYLMTRTKYVVFDKTGTLTKGVFEVVGVHHNTMEEKKILEYAALTESFSSHPISRSLKTAYGKEIDQKRVTDVEEISGNGVTAKVDGTSVAVGNTKLMKRIGVEAVECHQVGTVIHVAIDGAYAGHILISDVLKPTSKEAIVNLKKNGIKETVMLTGDIDKVAQQVAGELGVDRVYSELLPADKVSKVEELLAKKTEKEKLAFVGDGINDAPVLSRADIGIAMGALGSDAAIEAADVVLMDDDPMKIVKAIRIAKKCMRIVYENIYFAIGIKVICLLLGAVGIANMWVAIFADVGVMIIAVLNAIRTLFVKKL